MTGLAKIFRFATRFTVSCKVESGPRSFRNCFGRLSREAGHNRRAGAAAKNARMNELRHCRSRGRRPSGFRRPPFAELHLVEIMITPAPRHQLVVTARLDVAAALPHH